MKTISYTVVLHKRFNNDNFGVYIGEDIPSGIYIVTIEPNSPAANAKIQPGDRVLAVNGQLVSSMSMNPKEMMIQIANNAESLALSIQPSNILQVLGIGSMNDNDQDLPPQNKGIDRDLEKYFCFSFSNENNSFILSFFRYIISLFTENVEITPLVSSNRHEYALTSSGYAHRRRRRHRKHRPLKTVETQTSIIDEQKERLSQQRSIPSMGTSHALLRNTQLNPKDNEINNSPEIKPSPIKNSDFNTNEKGLMIIYLDDTYSFL
jgi:membrane-associated protease RseP (regulator of RpoE activity)